MGRAVRPLTCPGGVRTIALACGVSVPDLPENWKVLVSIVGLVAEEFLSDDADDADAIADALLFKIWIGEAFASDLALIGITDIGNCELSYQVIEEAARISREGCWSSTGGRVSDSVRRRVNFLPRSSPLTL